MATTPQQTTTSSSQRATTLHRKAPHGQRARPAHGYPRYRVLTRTITRRRAPTRPSSEFKPKHAWHLPHDIVSIQAKGKIKYGLSEVRVSKWMLHSPRLHPETIIPFPTTIECLGSCMIDTQHRTAETFYSSRTRRTVIHTLLEPYITTLP